MAEISSHFMVFLADPGLSAATESLHAGGSKKMSAQAAKNDLGSNQKKGICVTIPLKSIPLPQPRRMK